MFSRRSAILLGEFYEGHFWEEAETLFEFLFEREYPMDFCRLAETAIRKRSVKRFIIEYQSGNYVPEECARMPKEECIAFVQERLRKMSEDALNIAEGVRREFKRYGGAVPGELILQSQSIPFQELDQLQASLELDGYKFSDRKLWNPEHEVIDTQAEAGFLQHLYTLLGINDTTTTFHFLRLSEEHYINHNWNDSIGNARQFLENTLKQIALSVQADGGQTLVRDRPIDIRTYLESEGVLDQQEREAIQYSYGLISNRGSHPRIAGNDEARLMRNLALAFAQYALLRYQDKRNQV